MPDAYSNVDTLTSQGRKSSAITPADGSDLTDIPKALWINVAGDISVDPVDGPGTALVFTVPQGIFDAVRVKRVRTTGTTATGIRGIY